MINDPLSYQSKFTMHNNKNTNWNEQSNKVIKGINKKYINLEDKYYDLQQEHDKLQYEVKCIKEILSDVCQLVAPHHSDTVDSLIDNHDRNHKTIYSRDGQAPLNSIRFRHQYESHELGLHDNNGWKLLA
ncbi:PxORF31 peptide [Plutella xylostella granulovirus]|uniref:PxORF31 peptide n=1 Tax=Plutella xylostella granulovirus TaxID=98383 RepID=Q9DW00_9BBAC|nr:PxORF31 peptide [Plutella xylostella granulovirus]AAG27329.1 PxORF31 peptide [Plutella xylostella granulovirus]